MTVSDGLIGATVGHCAIVDLLGQGGMASVYRGRQEHLDRDVAIKILPPHYAADLAFVERFKLEARATARLSHPHIVTVHDAGEEGGHLYIIMELVAGGTLRQRLAAGLPPAAEVVRVVREVASALDYAHAAHVIHRDVKPANVLLDPAGRAVLSDFGIAKVMQSTGSLTSAGAGVGTPEYMSPEQCRGVAVDARADIYALGVMLYEMLTGRTPFVADNFTALAHAHIYEPPPPPSRINPRISPAVQAVILKALEKVPAERFQTASELASDLDEAIDAQTPMEAVARRADQPGHAPPAPRPPVPSRPIALLCPRCRRQTPASARFCTHCGQPLAPGPTQVRPAPAPQPTGSWTRCPSCGALNQPQHRFCTQCGGRLLVGVVPVACRRCGAPNAVGTRFCTRCGAQFF